MSTTVELDSATPQAPEFEYRVLSTMAVLSLICGVLSLLALFDLSLGLIPLIGVLVGARALVQIRRRPQDLTGAGLAKAGIALSVLLLVTGWVRIGYIYATEVPDGYMRVSYESLQPDEPGQQVPQSAIDLDGKRVFIKGYAYPGAQKTGIKEFILCRDNGDCCFGGEPKLTDMIQVTLAEPLAMEYTTSMRRLAGTFRVEPAEASDSLGSVLYHLEADYLK